MRPLPTTALAVLVTALTSVVAVAQTRPATPPRSNRAGAPAGVNRDSQPRQPRAARIAPDGPQRGPEGVPASGLLRLRQQLELTDDQVKRLEALRAAPRPERNEADMLRARADLMEATRGDVNLDKARAAFDRMARVRTDEQLAQLKARQELRNVLTPAQRTKLDGMRSNLRRRGDAMGMRGGQMGRREMRGPGRMGQGRPGQGMRGPGMRGPSMRGRMGGPGMGGPGVGRGMGPGMGGQGMGGQPMPGGMGPGMQGGRRGMMGPGMAPGMGQGPGATQPGVRRRMMVPPPAGPPEVSTPPADSIR